MRATRGWELALAFTACAHAGRPAALPVVPVGCAIDLSGNWEHEGSTTFRYQAQDDGVSLQLRPYRVNGDGTPMVDEKAQAVSVRFTRQADGFRGEFRMLENSDSGQSCNVQFPAKVTSCTRDRLTLEIEQSYAVDEQCHRLDTGGSDVATHVLVRF